MRAPGVEERAVRPGAAERVAEVAARSAQLSMTSRRVLIMMDGKRTLDELATLVRPGEIEAIVTRWFHATRG